MIVPDKSTPPPEPVNPCAPLGGTLDDLETWAADLPTDGWGEHLYRVVTQLVHDVRDDCAKATTP
jgi:hypothetical protein